MGKCSEQPKGDESTVEPQLQREHRPREACLPQRGWGEEKRVRMGRRRRI